MPEGTAEEPIVHPSGGNETGPSHAARLAALRARVDKEDREAAPPKVEAEKPAPKSAPAVAADSAQPKPLEERIRELADREAQRRAARAANKTRDRSLEEERDKLARENAELREAAKLAKRWEAASPAEKLQMAAEGQSPEQLAASYQVIGSEEWKEAQRVRREGTDREKALLARLEKVEQESHARSRQEQMRAAEQAFLRHFDGEKASFPLIARLPQEELVQLAHEEADALHSRGHEVSHEAILTSLEAKAKRLAAMFGETPAEGAEALAETAKRQPPGRATPRLTQRAAQETAKVDPQGRVSHKDRVRRLVARENAR